LAAQNAHSNISQVAIYPLSRAVLANKRIFTGLRFEVDQASRGLSAIAELLVILDYCAVFATLYV